MNRAIINQYKKVTADSALKPTLAQIRVNPSNILQWHIRLDIADSAYVLRAELPQNYPAAQPKFIMLSNTPKYDLGEAVCLGDDAQHCVGMIEFITLLIAQISLASPKRETAAPNLADFAALFL